VLNQLLSVGRCLLNILHGKLITSYLPSQTKCIMPKALSSHWRHYRHFKPLTIHCEFPPERTYTPPQLTQHKVFTLDADSSARLNSSLAQAPVPTAARSKIPKPRGEVSRINRGGYNLQDTLGWPSSEYEEIRVSDLCNCNFSLLCPVISQNFVTHLAREYLKLNKSWSKQSKSSVTVLYQEVRYGSVLV
jgi:hypothetical protein